jgi:hypothetical protein
MTENTPISKNNPETAASTPVSHKDSGQKEGAQQDGEVGGQKGPEPTRYGDWEKNGRCTDF